MDRTSQKRAYMIGVLEGWLNSTSGAEIEILALQAKVRRGDVVWTGRNPTGPSKRRH